MTSALVLNFPLVGSMFRRFRCVQIFLSTVGKDRSHPGDGSKQRENFDEGIIGVSHLPTLYSTPMQQQRTKCICIYTGGFLSCFSLYESRLYSVQTSEEGKAF